MNLKRGNAGALVVRPQTALVGGKKYGKSPGHATLIWTIARRSEPMPRVGTHPLPARGLRFGGLGVESSLLTWVCSPF